MYVGACVSASSHCSPDEAVYLASASVIEAVEEMLEDEVESAETASDPVYRIAGNLLSPLLPPGASTLIVPSRLLQHLLSSYNRLFSLITY